MCQPNSNLSYPLPQHGLALSTATASLAKLVSIHAEPFIHIMLIAGLQTSILPGSNASSQGIALAPSNAGAIQVAPSARTSCSGLQPPSSRWGNDVKPRHHVLCDTALHSSLMVTGPSCIFLGQVPSMPQAHQLSTFGSCQTAEGWLDGCKHSHRVV